MIPVTRAHNAMGAIALAVLLHMCATSAGTLAQGGGYTLQPDVVGGGGTTMHGGTWTLDGTVAQTAAMVQDGSGGVHLEGGFWSATPVVPANDHIFASGFEAPPPINRGAQYRH